jgi:hypothetical protein
MLDELSDEVTSPYLPTEQLTPFPASVSSSSSSFSPINQAVTLHQVSYYVRPGNSGLIYFSIIIQQFTTILL